MVLVTYRKYIKIGPGNSVLGFRPACDLSKMFSCPILSRKALVTFYTLDYEQAGLWTKS